MQFRPGRGCRIEWYGRGEVNPGRPEWRSQPAGIVFHTTESDLAPFEPGQTRQLKHIGSSAGAHPPEAFVSLHDRPVRTGVPRGGRVRCRGSRR